MGSTFKTRKIIVKLHSSQHLVLDIKTHVHGKLTIINLFLYEQRICFLQDKENNKETLNGPFNSTIIIILAHG